MDESLHMIEARGELIPHPEERGVYDWMVKLTLAKRETDPITKDQFWREIDHTVVNHHGLDFGGATVIALQRKLFNAIGEPSAVRTIVQRSGDVLTLDWLQGPDSKQVEVKNKAAINAAGALIEEARLTLAKVGLIGG